MHQEKAWVIHGVVGMRMWLKCKKQEEKAGGTDRDDVKVLVKILDLILWKVKVLGQGEQ